MAAAGGQAWAVGVRHDANLQDGALVEHWDGKSWRVVNGPDPTPTDEDRLGGVTTAGNTIWAVGYYKDNGRKTLIERRQTAAS